MKMVRSTHLLVVRATPAVVVVVDAVVNTAPAVVVAHTTPPEGPRFLLLARDTPPLESRAGPRVRRRRPAVGMILPVLAEELTDLITTGRNEPKKVENPHKMQHRGDREADREASANPHSRPGKRSRQPG